MMQTARYLSALQLQTLSHRGLTDAGSGGANPHAHGRNAARKSACVMEVEAKSERMSKRSRRREELRARCPRWCGSERGLRMTVQREGRRDQE